MDPASSQADARDDGLFDEFLELALQRGGIDPSAFCAERGLGDPPAWLLELHALVQDSNPVSPASAQESEQQRRLGDYLLVRRLGEGGMGVVYLAEDDKLHRHVALKTVRPELAGSPTALQRFEREARALARLRHPGIAAVHAYGEADGVRFLAMELIPGRDLDEVLAAGPLPVEQAVRVARDLAEALAAAHAAGVLHRDVKPANVRISSEDRTVLMDFGLARQLDGSDPTLTGSFAGSPAYAAPEQLTGAREVDERTDVYGLGATLYQLLVGQVPFAGDSVDQIMRRVLSEDPRPPRRLRPEIPRDVEAVVLRALERDAERRYQTATEFAADLEAVLAGRSVQARPLGPVRRVRGWMRSHRIATAAIAVVLLGAGAGAGALAVDSLRLRSQRQGESARLVREARAAMARHGDARDVAADASRKLRALDTRLVERPLNRGEERARVRFTAESKVALVQREAVFANVVTLLSRAQGLDPESEFLERAWAEMHYHQWLDLRQSNAEAAALHFDRVRELDHAGDLAAEVVGVQRVAILSQPPGAEVHLFRWREHREIVDGGDPRLVPVGADNAAARELVLRVEQDVGHLRIGDYITAVEGRAPSAVVVRESRDPAFAAGSFWEEAAGDCPEGLRLEPAWQFLRKREGHSLRVDVLRGVELLQFAVESPIDVVPTWSACVPTAATKIGTTPIPELVLEPGSYLVVLRASGYRDCRLPFHVDHAVEVYSRPRVYEVAMTRHAVPGFVHIPGEAYGLHKYFVQRAEVSNAQYLEFVNQRKQPDRWLPRRFERDEAILHWPIVDGRAELPVDLDPELPVTGVSWRSAIRFARWLPSGLGLDTARWYGVLPQYGHLARVGHGGDSRLFVHGDYFNPKWIKSRFARRTVGLEPGLSYPVDESPFGVFDLQGSVSEWLGDEKNPISEGTRMIFGGCWADSEPYRFQLSTYRTVPPAAGQSRVGFRVMLLERDDG